MRFNSYGMEIKYSDKSKFANEVKRGYFAVIESAKRNKRKQNLTLLYLVINLY